MRSHAPIPVTPPAPKSPWWQPALTASTLMIATGWLSGAWYEWSIQADHGMAVVFLFSALSTLWPGIAWQEIADMIKAPTKSK